MTHNTRELEEKYWNSKPKKKVTGEGVVVSLSKNEFNELLSNFHHQIQKARQDWLRSEIEKLEVAEKLKSKIGFEKPGTKMQQIKQRVFAQGHNQVLTSIITRYKEELKVLESK